jgi:3-hydroxybutyryl-CoA dehydrogenase
MLDWAGDPAECSRVVLAADPSGDEDSLHAAVGLCQAAGVAVTVVGDGPGLVVARTLAMLVNEAVELVGRREAAADDVDTAMVLGTAYPRGPLAWGDHLGACEVERVLQALGAHHPSGRYRPSPRLRDVAVDGMGSLRDPGKRGGRRA